LGALGESAWLLKAAAMAPGLCDPALVGVVGVQLGL